MRVVVLTVALSFLISTFTLISSADINHAYDVEVKHLKEYVAASECIFTRNGINYKGSEALTHINRKEAYFKKKITTTEDFIRLAATKSEISGKRYTVTCAADSTVNLSEWLLQALTEFRKSTVH